MWISWLTDSKNNFPTFKTSEAMKTRTTKTRIAVIAIAVFAALCGTAASAQEAAPLVPKGGFWIIESNMKTKDYTIVRFYTNADVLTYEEKLEGVYLNIRRKKTTKMLNQMLVSVTEQRLAGRDIMAGNHLVANAMKR